MEIKTLEHTSLAEITSVFNEAFRGYFVPLVMTEQTMAAKIKSEGIQLHYSMGAFENEKLVGFILHGYDVINGVKTIYNGGTGVVASFRGKGITSLLYQYCIPLLQQQGIHHHVLEVIDKNTAAIGIYQKIGFHTARKLGVYKGSLSPKTGSPFVIKEIEAVPIEMASLFEMEPAWQNSVASLERDKAAHKIAGVFIGDELVAFGSFIPSSGRVKHCFVLPAHRRKRIATGLLQFMQQNSSTGQLVATNIDDAYLPANQFLKSLGFEHFLSQYEMKMEVQ